MASAPRVGATSAAAPPQPLGGWGGGGSGSYSSVDDFDGAHPAGTFPIKAGWRPTQDDRHGQGYFFFGQYPRRENPEQPLFTPLSARFASAFAAVDPASEVRSAPILFADLVRGIGIYDLNLKVIAGTFSQQGSIINRYG